MKRKQLVPYMNIRDNMYSIEPNKESDQEAISIQDVLDFSEAGMLFQVGDSNKQFGASFESEEFTIVGITITNLFFNNTECQLLYLGNWTNHVKLLLSKQAK